jgi:phage terminase large subunit GpA-like protein
VIHFKHNAIVVGAEEFAAVFKPAVPIAPSDWAAAHLIVPDGPRAASAWDMSLTPYIREPLDMLGPESPVNEIAAMKSAQGGFTLLLIALLGHTIDRNPCRAMIIQPTDAALSKFNREKLGPAIRASAVLRKKVATQTSRSAEGSTTYSKRFSGGSLTLAIATSAADLRSDTIKILLRDEIDQYPDDLDGQGDPLEMSDGRQMAFLASADWKKADISTPTIKGASKIERRYLAGDQRRWHVPCPNCEELFVFEFGPNFRFSMEFPHRAYYVAPCCGGIVEPHQKIGLVRAGRWIARAPRPGAFPSYHFDALSSPFVPWDEVAKAFVAAGDDPEKLKTFRNLWLGLPYEMRGDAPDHVRLLERREDGPPRGHVPARGILLVAAADVQMRGIWCEILAIAPNRESWVVDAFYCDGSTEAPGSLNDAPGDPEEPGGNAFTKLLHKTIAREFPDAFGGTRSLDALGIDSGYRSHIVYSTVRNNQRMHPSTGEDKIFAIDGRDGWGKPPMGTPALADISLGGVKIKKGVKIWPVGTWPLKGAFYADLRKDGLKAGAEVDPDGYCHFGGWLDENYFRQLTAEYLAEETYRGRPKKVWKLRASERDNHFLDCRIYNLALAEYLGLSSITPQEWAALAKERGMPKSDVPTLFKPLSPGDASSPPATPAWEEPTGREITMARLQELGRRNDSRWS